jgi:hypothetical protein
MSAQDVSFVPGQAIFESVLPRQAQDLLPGSEAGVLVAVTDRLDSLVGLMAAGCTPTASADPFGLRRMAYGMLEVCHVLTLVPGMFWMLMMCWTSLNGIRHAGGVPMYSRFCQACSGCLEFSGIKACPCAPTCHGCQPWHVRDVCYYPAVWRTVTPPYGVRSAGGAPMSSRLSHAYYGCRPWLFRVCPFAFPVVPHAFQMLHMISWVSAGVIGTCSGRFGMARLTAWDG